MRDSHRKIFLVAVILSIITITYFIVNYYFNQVNSGTIIELPFSEFYNYLLQRKINTANIAASSNSSIFTIKGIINGSQQYVTSVFKIDFGFIQSLIFHNVKVAFNSESISILDRLLGLASMLLQIVFMLLFFRDITFKPTEYTIYKGRYSFKDIIGMKEEKNKLMEFIEPINNYEHYKLYNAMISKGIVFYGPPGNGKTYLAEACSLEIENCYFFPVNPAGFAQLYVGAGPLRVKQIFSQAREFAKNNKCRVLIMFDEADSFINRSEGSGGTGGYSEHYNIVNTMLQEMQSRENNDIFWVFCTNFIDNLDEALIRSLRIDFKLCIGLPNYINRLEIIKDYFTKSLIPLSPDVNFEFIALQLRGFSRADIINLLNQSLKKIAFKRLFYLDIRTIFNTMIELIMGLELLDEVLEHVQYHIAVHEMGHAFIQYYYQKIVGNVSFVTILGRNNGVGGFMSPEPRHEQEFDTRDYIEKNIQVCLAARLSEEIFEGTKNVTTGCSSDISQARQFAERYVLLGMDSSYGLSFITARDRLDSNTNRDVINLHVKDLIDRLEAETRSILISNRNIIKKCIDVLYIQKTLSGSDLAAIIENNALTPQLSTLHTIKMSI